jgi:coronin-7
VLNFLEACKFLAYHIFFLLSNRRRDSLKQRDRDSNKEDESKRKSIPFDMVRQKSDLNKESLTDSNRILPTKKESTNATLSKRTSTVFGKVSKFRHLKGTTGHKSTQIENLRNLSRQIPGECDGFHGEFCLCGARMLLLMSFCFFCS